MTHTIWKLSDGDITLNGNFKGYLRRATCAAYIFVFVFFEYLHMRNFSVFSICLWFIEEFDYTARVQHVLHTTRCYGSPYCAVEWK